MINNQVGYVELRQPQLVASRASLTGVHFITRGRRKSVFPYWQGTENPFLNRKPNTLILPSLNA